MFKAIVPTPPAAPVSRAVCALSFHRPRNHQKMHQNMQLQPLCPTTSLGISNPTVPRPRIHFVQGHRCTMRYEAFETSYPLIGQRIENGGAMSTVQVGELMLQSVQTPPLPGITPEQLPQSFGKSAIAG